MESPSRRQRTRTSRATYRRRRAAVAVVVLVVVALLGWVVTAAVSSLSETEDEPQSAESSTDVTDSASSQADGDQTAPGPTAGQEPSSPENADPSPTESEEPEPQRASEASGDPDSIHVLVNRQNPLDPPDYEPADLVYPDVPFSGPEAAMQMRQEAAEALEELIASGEDEGMYLGLVSAYRSFDYQRQIYAARHAEVGTDATDLYMSRPGYSEHQTGLAADVISIANPDCMLGECFADTPEGQWVAENAHQHGFVIRYLEGMEDVTGYPYEPWHLRYVGEETATEVYAEGLTLEEYWKQDPAPDYDEDEPNPEHLNHTY